jgi:hypothetical protein
VSSLCASSARCRREDVEDVEEPPMVWFVLRNSELCVCYDIWDLIENGLVNTNEEVEFGDGHITHPGRNIELISMSLPSKCLLLSSKFEKDTSYALL